MRFWNKRDKNLILVSKLVLVSVIIYLFVGNPLPKLVENIAIFRLLIVNAKIISLVSNIAIGIIASGIFYYFVVFLPEEKLRNSLDKIVGEKINLLYLHATGIAWELNAANQLKGQGIDVKMTPDFIREWCGKTDLSLQSKNNFCKHHAMLSNFKVIDTRHLIYEHWLKTQEYSKEISNILITNLHIADTDLLNYIQVFEHTDFSMVLTNVGYPYSLVVVQERIIDIYNKAIDLEKYYNSIGGVINIDS